MGRDPTGSGEAAAIMAACGIPDAVSVRPLRSLRLRLRDFLAHPAPLGTRAQSSALMAFAAQAFLAEFRAWCESEAVLYVAPR